MKPLEKLIWSADVDNSHIRFREIADAKEELKRLRALEGACVRLNTIVEGVRNERWAVDGRRLKDTPEWCAFYCALKDQQNK